MFLCFCFFFDLVGNIVSGYGFVDFESGECAEAAVKALQAKGVQAQMAKVGISLLRSPASVRLLHALTLSIFFFINLFTSKFPNLHSIYKLHNLHNSHFTTNYVNLFTVIIFFFFLKIIKKKSAANTHRFFVFFFGFLFFIWVLCLFLNFLGLKTVCFFIFLIYITEFLESNFETINFISIFLAAG